MKNKFFNILIVCFCISLPVTGYAAKHYNTPQYAKLQSLDVKNKTIIVRNTVYKLRHAVKIHDNYTKFPSLSQLTIGNEIKFKTRKNKRTGEVEISEIWIQRM